MRLITATLIALLVAVSATVPAEATPPQQPACDRACWEQIKARQEAERLFWREVVKQQQAAAQYRRTLAFAAAVEAARRQQTQGYGWVQGVQVCNGRDLPTCYIVNRESRFQHWVKNPRSSAAGLYGLLRGWLAKCGLRGYAHFGQVPVPAQVACARYVWNGGRNTLDHRWLGPINWR